MTSGEIAVGVCKLYGYIYMARLLDWSIGASLGIEGTNKWAFWLLLHLGPLTLYGRLDREPCSRDSKED